YGVRGIPTLILFNQGKEVDKIVGMTNKASLEAMLAKV
ncbi:MAG: thiol reductase thioredoxin, partial [Deltaproteobacteria bacterium]|nr:thiol reductase thioredoxin [Deltaproteobacteria bacterium]